MGRPEGQTAGAYDAHSHAPNWGICQNCGLSYNFGEDNQFDCPQCGTEQNFLFAAIQRVAVNGCKGINGCISCPLADEFGDVIPEFEILCKALEELQESHPLLG